MTPTEDSFRALARSSPWRWTTLHFRHRDDSGEVEAWLRRPGQLLVRQQGRPDTYESGLPYTTSALTAYDAADGDTPPELRSGLPHEVQPELRPDGLVAERPSPFRVDYDDPMYVNYRWVAMLDPVELSHHVEVTHVAPDEVAGRPAWRARVLARDGYDPRCPCCAILSLSEPADRVDAEVSGREFVPREPGFYPDGYDVALDVQTGVVVRSAPRTGPDPESDFEVDILEVDADVDAMFAPRG